MAFGLLHFNFVLLTCVLSLMRLYADGYHTVSIYIVAMFKTTNICSNATQFFFFYGDKSLQRLKARKLAAKMLA